MKKMAEAESVEERPTSQHHNEIEDEENTHTTTATERMTDT